MNTIRKQLKIPRSRFHEQQRLKEMLRVDHAGELGAVRIYEGQLAGLAVHRNAKATLGQVQHMHHQEVAHLKHFEKTLPKHDVAPTMLQPIWKVAGTVLGLGTALWGPKMAHACTAAVETVIDHHYEEQIVTVRQEGDEELAEKLTQFQSEEVEHRDLALAHGAQDVPMFGVVRGLIEAGCRFAIKVSEKI